MCNNSSLYCLQSLLDFPEQQLRERFLMSGTVLYVRQSMALWVSIIKHIHMEIHICLHASVYVSLCVLMHMCIYAHV